MRCGGMGRQQTWVSPSERDTKIDKLRMEQKMVPEQRGCEWLLVGTGRNCTSLTEYHPKSTGPSCQMASCWVLRLGAGRSPFAH
jgi:hypothetical protein